MFGFSSEPFNTSLKTNSSSSKPKLININIINEDEKEVTNITQSICNVEFSSWSDVNTWAQDKALDPTIDKIDLFKFHRARVNGH
jgi:hypothetical protein